MTKTYSLYLSTLTGRTIQVVALATITGTSTINVTQVITGTIAVGQAFFTQGVGNFINTFGTGTGGTGTYNTTSTNLTVNTTASLIIFYTTNTNLLAYTPVFKNNLNNMKWNVNWREIFGNRLTGKCRVRCKLVSAASNQIYAGLNTGSVRCSLGCNSSNITNGFNLGCINPIVDNTLTNHNYLICDTTGGDGISVVIPNENQNAVFSVYLLDLSESYMSNVPEYQMWLYFDVDD